MSIRLKLMFCLVALAVCSAGVNAQAVTWYMSGGAFVDGGTFGGNFDYDASTNVYSAINVVTTPGTTRPAGVTYLFVCGSPDNPACGDGISPFPNSVVFLPGIGSAIGMPSLFLTYPSLADATFAATVPIFGDNEGDCANATCSIVFGATDRPISSGGTLDSAEPLYQMMYFGG